MKKPLSFPFFLISILLTVLQPISAKTLNPGQDLVLELQVKPQADLKSFSNLEWESFLINKSNSIIYPVVQAGDGSDVGWREPYVYFTVTVLEKDGSWKNLPKKETSRCGLFSFEWWKDVVFLKPKERLKLEPWQRPEYQFELPKKGHLQVRMHYEYKRGQNRKSKGNENLLKQAGLSDLPEFEIVSEPIEIEIK